MGRDAWQIARAADVIERSVAPPRSERVTTGVTKCVTKKIFAAEMAQALQRHAVEHAFTLIVAVQPDPAAPSVPVADYNIVADPAEFEGALLKELTRG